MTFASYDYNYQNAFRCSVCNVDLCHARAILHKRNNTEYNSLPQSILVLVVKWRHHTNVPLLMVSLDIKTNGACPVSPELVQCQTLVGFSTKYLPLVPRWYPERICRRLTSEKDNKWNTKRNDSYHFFKFRYPNLTLTFLNSWMRPKL